MPAENDALRDDAAVGRRLPYIKAVCHQCEATTASGVDNAASPTGNTAERIISPSGEADHFLRKNNWLKIEVH